MERELIIRMAREAGMEFVTTNSYSTRNKDVTHLCQNMYGIEKMERFAALVAAHERETFKVYVNQVVADREMAVHDAVLAEREACAKECDYWAKQAEERGYTCKGETHINGFGDGSASCAAAIRARSNQ